MEVRQVLHMNQGEGATSYAKNSTVQVRVLINFIARQAQSTNIVIYIIKEYEHFLYIENYF